MNSNKSKDTFKKGEKPEKVFDPTKNAEDLLESFATEMKVSKEDALKKINEFKVELSKLKK